MEYVSEKAFDRLDRKVESLDNKVDSLREDILVLSHDVKSYNDQVKNHVAGDNKIISEILPTIKDLSILLPELKAIVLERKAEEIHEVKSIKSKSNIKLTFAVLTGIVGFISAVYALADKILAVIK